METRWLVCKSCHCNVKYQNLQKHRRKIHRNQRVEFEGTVKFTLPTHELLNILDKQPNDVVSHSHHSCIDISS